MLSFLDLCFVKAFTLLFIIGVVQPTESLESSNFDKSQPENSEYDILLKCFMLVHSKKNCSRFFLILHCWQNLG